MIGHGYRRPRMVLPTRPTHPHFQIMPILMEETLWNFLHVPSAFLPSQLVPKVLSLHVVLQLI